MALGMARGGSARAELPRLTPLSFPTSSFSFPFYLFLFSILFSSPFLPSCPLSPSLFSSLFYPFLFPFLLLLSPSPPALLLPQKAENAEGQAPVIGPDGEVSPGSSHGSWDGQEGGPQGSLHSSPPWMGSAGHVPLGPSGSSPLPFPSGLSGVWG